MNNNPPNPPCNTDLTDVEQEARFLCERLRDLEGNIFDDEVGTEYYGHVAPSRARLEMLLADSGALLVSNRSGVEDLKHDLDRYMKIANIECNRAEKLQEALGVSLAALESVMRDEYDAFYTKVREAADIARNALDTENSEDHMSREG